MGVANILDQLQRPQLDLAGFRPQRQELQRHGHLAGAFRFPDLAKAAPAQEFLQPKARHRCHARRQKLRWRLVLRQLALGNVYGQRGEWLRGHSFRRLRGPKREIGGG